ncbi:hypothetical protein BLA6993_05349 [Burkholderia lata]|nr:hypothetical protein BLA6993_05349 [Burkholderia lata]
MYALSLEERLRESMASGAGWKALSDAAVNELIRLAPQNALAIEENRKQVFLNAWTTYMNGKPTE